jgi:two-component system response regulator FixJ
MSAEQGIVMVIDDDFAVCEALKFALELEGLSVRVCRSGAEALRHSDLVRACCLVVDYRMPGMDGLQLIERLAQRHVNIPTILITAQPSPALQRRAQAAGIRCVLEKPLQDSALVDSIHAIGRCS